MHADEILARWPETALVADVMAVRYRNIVSPAIGFADWKALAALCRQLVRDHPDLAGIVIGHGTATLEETAYFLNLTVKVSVPVVVVGAQRPSSALSSDAGMNLVNAIRVAASPEARDMGVLVVLNDEIHAAREVTKTSTLRLQTFRTPDFGVLGHADGDAVAFYRRPIRRHAPDTEFDISETGGAASGGYLLLLRGWGRRRGAGLHGGGGSGHHRGGVRAGVLPAGGDRRADRGGGAGDRRRAIHPRRVGADVSRSEAAGGGVPDRGQPQSAEGAHPAGAGADRHQ